MIARYRFILKKDLILKLFKKLRLRRNAYIFLQYNSYKKNIFINLSYNTIILTESHYIYIFISKKKFFLNFPQ